jgi:alpha-mannosidase
LTVYLLSVSRLTFHLIPHTHWDREWYLPRGRFGARLIRVIDDLIDILERQPSVPGFLLDGQTVLLEDYLQVRPDQRERVSSLVAQGRIETGPWYVLADEQIPSGESLIRNLQLGMSDCRTLGRRMEVLYSPDAFGHPAELPAIAAEFGLESGIAWRGIVSDHDLLNWHAPDGRSIVLYHLPPDGYETGSGIPSEPESVKQAWEPIRRSLVSRATSSHVAVMVGADHHAARTDLVQLREAIAQLEPGNLVRLSRLEDFIQEVKETPALPTLRGEQRNHGYTWALQGVHGTRSHQKRRNSRVELWLTRIAEPLAALIRLRSGPDQRPRLEWAWRSLVQSHFHDAIGGCASDDVAREVEVRQAEAEGIARELIRESVQELWGWDPDRARDMPGRVRPSLLIWNPVPRVREGIALAQVTRFRSDVLVGPRGNRVPRSGGDHGSFGFRTGTGEIIPVQVFATELAMERLDAGRHYPDQDEVELVRVAFEAPPVGGLSSAVLTLVPGTEIPPWGGTSAAGRKIANEHLEIEVAGDGSLTFLDRSTGFQKEAFLRIESEPDRGDTYSVNPGRTPVIHRARGPVRVRVLASGPMVAAVEISGQVMVPPTGVVETNLLVMLFRDDPLVRCTLRLDNQAADHRLRVRFASGNQSGYTIAGSQFGTQMRRAVVDAPHVLETPVATAPAHRFVGLPGAPGLAIFAPGFFEYEHEPGGDVLFTILRAVGQLSRSDLSTRPGHAGWPIPTPLAQCPGKESLDFAFAAGGEWSDASQLFASWEDLFLPLKAAWFRDWNGEGNFAAGIELEGEGLALSSLMPARYGEGIVIRSFNLLDHPTMGTLRFSFPVRQVQLVRADEVLIGELPTGADRRSVEFMAPPRGLVSLRVFES